VNLSLQVNATVVDEQVFAFAGHNTHDPLSNEYPVKQVEIADEVQVATPVPQAVHALLFK